MHNSSTIHPQLWEDLLGGIAGQQLRDIFAIYRLGHIEKAHLLFEELKKNYQRDITLIEESYLTHFGTPHRELNLLKIPFQKEIVSQGSTNNSQTEDIFTFQIAPPTPGLMIRHHLPLLDYRPISTPALYVITELNVNKKTKLKLTFPHPTTMVLSLLLLCLIAGSGGSILSIYNSRLHPATKVAGVASIPSPTPLPELTELEDLSSGFKINYPIGMSVQQTKEGIELTTNSGRGKLILTYTNNAIISQIEAKDATDDEKALLQFAKVEAEKSFTKVDPKQIKKTKQ